MVKHKIIIGDSRKMVEVSDDSIGLIVTSPPYWNIKDYGQEGQIGYGQTLHEYLKDLYRVWKECYRILTPGRRLCVNIGDQFARTIIYGRYKVIPLHAEIIAECEDIGFDYMGSIIWQKKTTMNTTGGATVMGSYPYPPNGIIEIDYEFILIFKKPGVNNFSDKAKKSESSLSKEEWKTFFTGHWTFGGAKQKEHEAMFPDELPYRLIKMFSFVDDVVLDPFLGSGTTVKVAMDLNRNSIGYEINDKYLDIIKEKVKTNIFCQDSLKIYLRKNPILTDEIQYQPTIQNAEPKISPQKLNFANGSLYKVTEIISADVIKLNTGLLVKLLGVSIIDNQATIDYLKKHLLNKEVILKFDKIQGEAKEPLNAYVYLKNKIFINSYLIKSSLAVTDRGSCFDFKDRFLQLEETPICPKNGF
ncbi:MAG TPA: DNA methyltransferase [Caldisericia bacterium]|nr:DNA methyltransferase [Caldisericia bacterium]